METEKIKVEAEIIEIIKSDNGCETSFEYETVPTIVQGDLSSSVEERKEVRAITFNPKTNESFLLFKVSRSTEVEALRLILEYVKNHRAVNYSFTVVWSNNKERKTNTSYFYAKDIMEALQKFFHGKYISDYMVFEVKMNPLS